LFALALKLPRFSGLQRRDQVSRQEVHDEEKAGTTSPAQYEKEVLKAS
jgi:hypothetical protein